MKGYIMESRNEMIDAVALKQAIWGKRDEIAKMLEISPTSLSRKIHGSQMMSADELIRTAYYLNIDIRKLIKLSE